MKISKYAFVILISIAWSFQICFGQVTFQKMFHRTDRWCTGTMVQKTFDGGFIICGESSDSNNDPSDLLIKTNSNGEMEWAKFYDESNYNRGAVAFQQTTDSGFIVLSNVFIPNTFGIKLFKTDYYGNILWAKNIIDSTGITGLHVIQNSKGGFMITGRKSINSIESHLFLINTDSTGTILWAKTYDASIQDQGRSILETQDKGYIITGKNVDSTHTDVLVIKTDSVGNLTWSKSYGRFGASEGVCIKSNVAGGYIITGHTDGFGVDKEEVYLVSIDEIGNLLWSKTYGTINTQLGNSVEQASDSGFVITGVSFSMDSTGHHERYVYLLKTDSIGNLSWSKILGDPSWFSDGNWGTITDDGYILTGYTYSATLEVNILLIKTDLNGLTNCLDSNFVTTTINPATHVSNPIILVDSLNLFELSISSIDTSGVTEITLCTTLAVSATSIINTLTLFPNPTSGNFTITFPSTINKGSIDVYNTIGTKLFSQNITKTNSANIQLNNFAKGIYFVQMNDGEKQFCKKIVIE